MRLCRRFLALFLLTLIPAALMADCRAFSGTFNLGRDAEGRLTGTGALSIIGEAAPMHGRLTFADFAAAVDGSSLSVIATQELVQSDRRAAGTRRVHLRKRADGSRYEVRATVPLSGGARRGETTLEGTIDLALSTSVLGARGMLCD